jgi:dipeptidyl-peptidase-4
LADRGPKHDGLPYDDNTDSIYPVAKPVEYPIAGVPPSPFKIGVVNVSTEDTKWMDIPTDLY